MLTDDCITPNAPGAPHPQKPWRAIEYARKAKAPDKHKFNVIVSDV